MNKIEELINKYCPRGVEFKELGEVCEIKRGQSITKKEVVTGEVPVIAGGQTPAYYHNISNRDSQTIVISGSGAYSGFVSFWKQPIFVSDAFTVKPYDKISTKYCYYWLQNIQTKLYNLQSGSGVPHVYPSNVAQLYLPIPPLEVQIEIVAILDKFTELEAELEAELIARQQQYTHYRNKLLTFKDINNGI